MACPLLAAVEHANPPGGLVQERREGPDGTGHTSAKSDYL
jgi:hypothetical protein